MRNFSLLTILVLFSVGVFAQGTYVPLGSDAEHIIDRLDIKYSKIIPIQHTTDKPYQRGKAGRLAEVMLTSNLKFNKVQEFQIKWLADDNAEWVDSVQSKTKRPLWKFYKEPASFLMVNSKNKKLFNFRLNPVLDLTMGAESYQSRFIFNSVRGLEVRGNIKSVFSFYFNVLGNAARPQYYVTDKIKRIEYRYLPGQSYWKDYSSKIFKFNDGVDYFDARGYINVNVLKYINISMGRDKFFIGNGQRSFFLSDFSSPYLFLKLDVNVWRVRYQSIFAELTNQYIRGTDRLLPKKYMAVHHLSIQPTHYLSIGLFEAVIMKRSNHFELQYLNPIIFYRAVEHSLGSPDNVMVGGDFKVNLINHLSIYYQVLLDEFNFKYAFNGKGWWANKWAMQAGIKYIDIAPNLDGQFEFNIARPYMYTHPSGINYSNYNQPLAHPLGANFYEVILKLRYQPIPKLALDAKFVTAKIGADTTNAGGISTNFGSDILANSGSATVPNQFGNKLTQGVKSSLNYFQFVMTYQPWHNVYIDANILYRAQSVAALNKSQSSFYFGVGARMNIAARRYEF
jgi:hypothetical protein